MLSSSLDSLLLARFRRIHAARTGQQSQLGGHRGLVEQVSQELTCHAPDEILHIEVAVLADFLGPVGRFTGPLVHRWPRMTARIIARLLRTVVRYIVGPMRSVGDAVIDVPRCAFLAGGGRGACVVVCKKPVESYLHGHLGLQTELNPDFASGSCRLVVGTHPRRSTPPRDA